MKAVGLFVLLAVAAVAYGQSFEEQQYQRQLKEYEEKKAIYDRFQAIANVPVLASNDLVSKLPANQIPPGYAEQLLPNYTGKPVQFTNLGGPVVVAESASESETVSVNSPSPTTRPAPVPVRTATPLRPGPQNIRGLPVATRANLVQRQVSFPGSAPRGQLQFQATRSPSRPTGLILFSNAQFQLPSLAQRLNPAQSVQGNRNVRTTVQRTVVRS